MERTLHHPLDAFRGLFSAMGFSLRDRSAWSFAAARGDDRFEVWVPPLGERPDALSPEAARTALLADLDGAAPAAGVTRLALLPSLLTLGPAFQTELRGRGVEIRAYGQFLDDDYKETEGAEPLILKRSAEEWRAARAGMRARGALRGRTLRLVSDALLADLPNVDAGELSGERRVSQGYAAKRLAPESAARFGGGDLLGDLVAHLRADDAERAEVILIIGQAGIGKSQLFDALYVYLNRLYMGLKRAQRVAARPVRFTPEELARAPSYSSSELFAAVAEAPEAAFGETALMDWRMRQGLMLLMFDGLDEFFAAQDDFFQELKQRYLGAGSRAKLLICLRDSLLATSPRVKALVADLEKDATCRLSILELTPWREDDARLREFAWVRLENRPPAPEEADTPKVAAFLAALRATPELRDLASLPFFLEAILRYRREDETEPLTALEVLRRLVADIVAREWRKLEAASADGRAPQSAFARVSDAVIRRRTDFLLWLKSSNLMKTLETVFGAAPMTLDQSEALERMFDAFSAVDGREGFEQLIEDVAYAVRRGGSGHGVTRERLIALYGQDRPSGMTSALRRRGELILRQFALFGYEGADSVDFNHVIVADYLAARSASRRLRAAPKDVAAALGRAPSDETDIFRRALEASLAEEPALLAALRTAA